MSNTLELPVQTLPSKGYGYKFSIVKLPKLELNQIIDYSAELESSKNELSDLLIMLKHLILTIPNGEDVSMYDAIPLIAIRSYSSASDKLNDFIRIRYYCPYHDKFETMKVDLTKMEFNDISKELKDIKRVRISDEWYNFRIPTVKQFIITADKLKLKVPVNYATKYIWMLSAFDGIELDDEKNDHLADRLINKIIHSDSTQDLLTLNKIHSLLTGAFTHFIAHCENKEGGEPVVRINTIKPITEIFQNIFITQEFDPSTFDNGETDQSKSL